MSSDDIVFPSTIRKTWTVSRNATENITLEGLAIDIPGRVFVSYNASLIDAAQVTVHSDSSDILDLIETKIDTTKDGESFIRTTVGSAVDVDIDVSGTLLVHVIVSQPLSWVDSNTDAVLEDGSLVNSPIKKLWVRATDNGKVYIESSVATDLYGLELIANDDAVIQYNAPSLNVVKALRLKADDRGSVAIQAKSFVTQSLDSFTADAGAVYVTSPTTIRAVQLDLDADDESVISIYPQGVCQDSSIQSSDDSLVYAGSVACQKVDVRVSDGGYALVQAIKSLTTKVRDAGRIQYFNATPSTINTPRMKKKKSRPDATPTQADINTFDSFEFQPLPTQNLVNIKISLYQRENFIIRHYETLSDPTTIALSSAGVVKETYSDLISVVGLFLVAIVGFVVLRARGRNGYMTLPIK